MIYSVCQLCLDVIAWTVWVTGSSRNFLNFFISFFLWIVETSFSPSGEFLVRIRTDPFTAFYFRQNVVYPDGVGSAAPEQGSDSSVLVPALQHQFSEKRSQRVLRGGEESGRRQGTVLNQFKGSNGGFIQFRSGFVRNMRRLIRILPPSL